MPSYLSVPTVLWLLIYISKESGKECCNEFPIFLTAVKDLLCGINSKWHVGEISGGRLQYFSVGCVLHVCVQPESTGLYLCFFTTHMCDKI